MVSLFDYQKKYLDNTPKNFVMAAGTGLGKSRMGLAHYHRHNPDGRLLVVAPAAKVRTGDWDHEVRLALGSFDNYQVLSYERFTKQHRDYMDAGLTVLFDEGHYIANAGSKRAKAAIAVARVAKQFVLLAATPLPNGWRSASTYSILFGLCRNKTEFERRFVIYDRSRTTFPLFLGYREENVLRDWWQSIAKPLERTGDLHLPSQSIGKVIELKPKQLALYNGVKKTRLYNGEALDSAPLLFARLRQITTPYRLDAIQSILEETDEHVVIFYNYNVEREALLELLEKKFSDRVVYEQSGHNSHLPDRSEWDTMPPSVTIGQYQSASTAIELTYASVTVFMSPTYSYSTYSQAMGRNKRHGQAKTVLYYMLKVNDTIDGAVWKALREKRDFDDRLYDESDT